MQKTLRYAFVQSLPVLFGYLFMGIAFGILLQNAGYNFIWAFFISLTCYAGSMQFVLINLLTGGASLLHSAFMTLMINFRHVFYGLSLIERFQNMGRLKPYMIHSLTDETYSLHCLVKPKEGMDGRRLMFYIAVLDHCYWMTGCVLGALLGSLITFDTTGIDFAMTALFVVIFVEQWKESKCHLPAIIGGGCALASLCIFGADNFLPPALFVTVALLLYTRGHIESRASQEV
ncbi:AzlC family ABC transporter permease [Intestinibacillus sp. Marseille-P6563]|uniref:AzlC family ABC transporter permease n=1 Tax=Intestinibacillus sp. Marseille-P6563 TaxID=2364792 RepID=UPI000F058EFF|nr:AzlC family ABC transporter permease [Intestinibacillus sp. Marseille-P6563]